MTSDSLGLINLSLAILAAVSVLELLLLAAVGVTAYRLYRSLIPLRVKVDGILEDVQDVARRVRVAEESVSYAVGAAAGAGGLIADAVRAKAWPIWGLARGLRVAIRAMRHHDPDRALADSPSGAAGRAAVRGT